MENVDRYLFRGRRKGCAWVYGALIVRDGIPYIVRLDDHMGAVLFAVDPKSVGQCLGKKDKKEKIIFEGDILQKHKKEFFDTFDNGDMRNLEIRKETKKVISETKDGPFIVIVYAEKFDTATMDEFPRFWLKNECFGYEGEELEDFEDWEVIGNAYDNPELLETSEKDMPCSSPS